MPPSKLGVRAGGSVTAEQAILSLVTRSANDIAAAVGEHLGGTRITVRADDDRQGAFSSA